jgi:very-long-chain (3R)-3-hydroxyacyl-CoA dehydratase
MAEVSFVLAHCNLNLERSDSWSRYNMFIVLYPVGILSEMRLVYQVIQPSRARNLGYQYLLWFGLLLYVPG